MSYPYECVMNVDSQQDNYHAKEGQTVCGLKGIGLLEGEIDFRLG